MIVMTMFYLVFLFATILIVIIVVIIIISSSSSIMVMRLEITHTILRTRRNEKREWLKNLERMAGRGDDNAITYLQRRATRAKSGHISSLYKHCGGKQQAIQNVRQHFDDVLAPSELNSDVESIHQELQNKAANREAVLFSLGKSQNIVNPNLSSTKPVDHQGYRMSSSSF